MTATANPFTCTSFANNPPADPLRRAARALEFGTVFTAAQIDFIRAHDWCVMVHDGRAIVVDNFSFEGRHYSEKLIWGGTFAELKAWAGY